MYHRPMAQLAEITADFATARELELHGHRVTYRTAGSGPVVLLVHGIAGSSEQWGDVAPILAEGYTVVAPDLLGHGQSAKPIGDYSLGAYAVSMRDLLLALGHGREVHPLLRAATLPGAELVLPLIASQRVLGLGGALGAFLARTGLRAGPDIAEMARGYASLADAEARRAFLNTVRAVIDYNGQRVSAADRLYLSSMLPSMIVWGRRDPLIPADHAEAAHALMPGSRLEIFEEAGHFPQLDDPFRFAGILREFLEETEAAEFEFTDEDFDAMRERMLAHSHGE